MINIGTLRKFPSATVHRRADGAVHTYAFGSFGRLGDDVTHKAQVHALCD